VARTLDLPQRRAEVIRDVDVCVAGGGPAGLGAALAAARQGARVCLLERYGFLGGNFTVASVGTICGLYLPEGGSFSYVTRGLAEEVAEALKSAGAANGPVPFKGTAVLLYVPWAAKRLFDHLVGEQENITLFLHALVADVVCDGDQIDAVVVATKRGPQAVRARAFVDATGDADLAQHAAADVRYGTDGWVQNGSLGVRFGGIEPHAEVTTRTVGDAVRAAKARGVQNLIAEAGLIARMPISGDVIAYMVDEGYDARSAADTSRAEIHARLQAQSYLQAIRTIPGAEHAYIVTTGPELGTRESRHIITRHQLREEDILNPDTTEDAVAIGAWPMEHHPGPGIPSTWKYIGDPGFYPIPLACLRSVNRANLYAAGRTLDGDRGAGASLRVMGTAFATGHASGIAAAQQALTGESATTTVREELLRQGARLPETVAV
jgi:hypothetical protein